MKTLKIRCLVCVAENLHRINLVSRYLAPKHKEAILEWLVNHDKLTVRYLPYITYNLFSPVLRKVVFYKCTQLSDAVLKQLHASQCQLHEIKIHGCVNVTDAGVQYLTNGQSELEVLILRKLKRITGIALKKVSSKQLVKVDLRGCSDINSAAIHCLVSANPTIQRLILVRCDKLDDKVFPHIATKLGKNLKELDIQDLHVLSDESLITIAQNCPNLQLLNIGGCNRLTGRGLLEVMKQCRELSVLDLSYMFTGYKTDLTVENHQCFTALPETITELSLSGIQLKDAAILVSALEKLACVRILRLCGVPVLDDTTLTEILSNTGAKLEELDLSGGILSTLTETGLQAVTKYCLKIRRLALSLLKNVTGISLLPLLKDPVRASQLTELMLTCKQLDMSVLFAVAANCVELERLDATAVANTVLFALAENCPKLKFINIKGSRQITDDGICELSRMCSLQYAVFSGLPQLTDKCVFLLADHCPNLEEIYLSGCPLISHAALMYLLDSCIPRVFIQHRVPNAEPNQLVGRNLDTGEFCRMDLLE